MSQRTDQVDSLLVKEISEILARDFEPPRGCLITVMRAQVTPDLKHATIYISILPEKLTGTAFEVLRKYAPHVQYLLNKKLMMKFVPKISWKIDDINLKYAAIDEAIKKDSNHRPEKSHT